MMRLFVGLIFALSSITLQAQSVSFAYGDFIPPTMQRAGNNCFAFSFKSDEAIANYLSAKTHQALELVKKETKVRAVHGFNLKIILQNDCKSENTIANVCMDTAYLL